MQPFRTTHCTRAVAVCWLAACSPSADAARGHVTRADSAGIEIVTSEGADHALAWTFEPVLRIGADEGPAAFGGLYSDGVEVDALGRIVVLDAMSQQVVVFDSTGAHLGTYGRKGGGPGELQFPNGIATDETGAISVYDFSKRGAIRFAADGAVLPSQTLPALDGTRIAVRDGRHWGVFAERPDFGQPALMRLLGIAADTIELHRFQEQAVKPVQFPNCAVTITFPPLLSPDLHFDLNGDRIAYAFTTDYSISIHESGRTVRMVRRAVAPEPVTPEQAELEVGDSMRIRFGSGACSIPPKDVVTARGTAEFMPMMRDVQLTPDGSLWVARGAGPRTEWRIDVFDASGAYVGTLPKTAPKPAAFRSPDELIAVERDELDRQSVVVYRIRRN